MSDQQELHRRLDRIIKLLEIIADPQPSIKVGEFDDIDCRCHRKDKLSVEVICPVHDG